MIRTLAIAFGVALLATASPAATSVETERVPGTAEAATPVKPEGQPPAAAGAVRYGTDGLPDRVREMRQRLLDAAYSGDIAALTPVIQSNELPPSFSVHDVGDPVEYLKGQSGDGDGREVLAILTDILESGWTRISPGTPQEMYVWPYFAEVPIEKLEPKQMVELFKVVTSSDVEEMRTAGRYLFYRVGIGPDGTWHYFKAGE